jgi:iron complex transport system ATP-binding protein
VTTTGIKVRDVAFRAGGRDVLHGVSLRLQPGELVALLGVNGAGKTTLLRILLGLLRPSSGEVLLDGDIIGALSRRSVARRMAYVPQAHVPSFPFNVLEIVAMGRSPVVGVGRSFRPLDEDSALQALDRLGMRRFAQRSYVELSGGERQAVLIARALAQGARVLIMDEPAASLDLGQQARLMTLLAGLARDGYAILMSSHQPDQALRWCDRAVLLHEGRVLSDGPPRDVITADRLSRLYGVPMQVIETETFCFVVSSETGAAAG